MRSLLQGVIPKVCPVCKNPLNDINALVVHHWGYLDREEAVLEGTYRRI